MPMVHSAAKHGDTRLTTSVISDREGITYLAFKNLKSSNMRHDRTCGLGPYLKASMETTRHAVIVGHLNS